MVVNDFWVLLLGLKNEKHRIRLQKNIFRQKEDKIQLKQTMDHITKRNSKKNFQSAKVHFTMLMKVIMMMRVIIEIMDSSSQQLLEGFANSCYKIVTPILLQKLINDFVVCKHQNYCSGALLLAEDVSHSFGNQNYSISKKNHSL